MGVVKVLAYVFCLVVVASAVLAATKVDPADYVISNSGNWQDVYSTVLYAKLQSMPGLFLTSSAHGPLLPYAIPKDKTIHVFSSQRLPYIVGYRQVLENFGFPDVKEDVQQNINLELARRLTSIDKYIVIDDAYGYNAISVASYAVIDDYYVLFANDQNIRAVEGFLATKNPTKVIIYGQVDARVKTILARFNPETINTGDRFQNNIEIVKRYLQKRPTKQVVLSNGEFIENGIMSGSDPVLFIGRGNVPDQIKQFIKESRIEVAILIGNELIGSATTIRREVGVSVFVKFAQGARRPSGPITTVEDLDRFPMPRYDLSISVYSIFYNKATRTLEVTFQNNVNIGTYLKSTIRIAAGGQTFIVGDDDVQFIDKNQIKTFLYNRTVDGELLLLEQDATGQVDTLFGESRKALEFRLSGNFTIGIIEVLDESMLVIDDIVYDRIRREFIITISNTGPVDAYVSAELLELILNGETIDLASVDKKKVAPGKTAQLHVPVVLNDEDIAANTLIKAKGYYGERQNALIKTTYAEFGFRYASIDVVYIILAAIIILLIILFFFLRKKCPECGHKNPFFRKRCKKCGALLRRRKRHEGHRLQGHERPHREQQEEK